jgi:hypothetical protein
MRVAVEASNGHPDEQPPAARRVEPTAREDRPPGERDG